MQFVEYNACRGKPYAYCILLECAAALSDSLALRLGVYAFTARLVQTAL